MKRIEEFSTNELANELCRRYDHWIIAARKELSNGRVERFRFYKGDFDVCAGLMHGTIQAAVEDNWGVNQANVINYGGYDGT